MNEQADLDALRNDAVVAWLQPSADEGRLQTFLAQLDPEQRREVEKSAREARTALEDLMSRPFPGDEDACLVATEVRVKLSSQFPWLSENGVRALIDYIDWI